MNLVQRASDEDRRRTVAALERHTAAGRLSLDEFAERVDRVLCAATLGDLARATADLPPEAVPDSADSRHLTIAFALAAAVVIALAVVFALWR